MLGRALDLFPADWSDGAKLAVLVGVIVVCFVVPVVIFIKSAARMAFKHSS